MTEKNAAPPDLAARGRKFWRETTGQFELTPAELEILKETCRTLDDLDRLAASVAAEGAMVLGSAGQPVVHPGLTEARGQRQVLHRLVAALALPDEAGAAVPSSQNIRAKRAAGARWRGHRTEEQKRAAVRAAN